MITEITEEQRAYLPVFRKEWMERAHRTGPSDRETAERGARVVYEAHGVPYPERIIWVPSPKEAVRVIRTEIGYKGDLLTQYAGGQFRAFYVGWLEFGRYLGVQYDHPEWLDAMIDLCGVSWWFPFDDVAVFCDSPEFISFDDEGRLHNLTGPAIRYSDGWATYVLRNVRVTQQIVEAPETLTVQQVLDETNSEVRSIMMERMGTDALIREGGLRYVSECEDPANSPYMLRLYVIPEKFYGVERWGVHCVNATPDANGVRREYLLSAPMDLDLGAIESEVDAIDVMAWINTTDRETYLSLARAC